jgi:hypothetical protein
MVTEGESFRMKDARSKAGRPGAEAGLTTPRGVGTSGGHHRTSTWPLNLWEHLHMSYDRGRSNRTTPH